MRRAWMPLLIVAVVYSVTVAQENDINATTLSQSANVPTADLVVPPVIDELPAAGKRVRQVNSDYAGTDVYHLLYLPTDWQPGTKYPVVVEYAGNKYKSSLGTVEGSSLGYGLSAGEGVIWVCMPYVNRKEMKNEVTWWGDVDATVKYCKHTVQRVCAEYGGDADNVFLVGFSRGAIACNYIGLRDDEIASLWRGFICHSHYDGVKAWPYSDSDRIAAGKRLQRLAHRPQFISHENSVAATQDYLREAYPSGNFTFVPLPDTAHTDTWVLFNTPQRAALRKWFNEARTRDP